MSVDTCEYTRENVIIREYILPNIGGGGGGELIHCADQYCRLEHTTLSRTFVTQMFGVQNDFATIVLLRSVYVMPRTHRIFVHFGNGSAFFPPYRTFYINLRNLH